LALTEREASEDLVAQLNSHMRIRTGLVVLAACCVALAACTAGPPKGPNTTVSTPAVGRPPPPASAEAAVSREAFTPYASLGVSSDDGLAPGESASTFTGACMTAAGYPGAASSVPQIINLGGRLSFSLPWGPWGYLGVADAQQYGFRIPPGFIRSALDIGTAVLPNPASLSPAEQAAAGKCLTILQELSKAMEDGPLAGIGTLGNDISTDVLNDPAVKAADRAWSACMAKNGYSADQPLALLGQERQAMYGNGPVNIGAPVSSAANQAQIAAAVTDINCTQSSDLAGIYFAVQASYEQQLVTANQQALTAAVSAYRAGYAKDLSKLSALLRTAKAQPFHPGKRARVAA
jgi:hypothetical protein